MVIQNTYVFRNGQTEAIQDSGAGWRRVCLNVQRERERETEREREKERESNDLLYQIAVPHPYCCEHFVNTRILKRCSGPGSQCCKVLPCCFTDLKPVQCGISIDCH